MAKSLGGNLLAKTLLFAGILLSACGARAGGIGADAIVLVNSASTNYPDFQHYLQPYLDNFGVPYTVLDIASNPVPATLGQHALIIIGHGKLDTNQTFLNAAAQSNIVTAVSLGSGLVNFDGALTNTAAPAGYPYVQSLFGFGYTNGSSATTITFPTTETSNSLHYITSLHATTDSLALTNSMALPGVTFGTNVTAIVLGNGKPLVAIAKYGQGRVVQFTSYAWMAVSVLGPVNGMDDTLWRSFVWAARKPFVMRGLPNFATMRVDDISGPFTWVHTVNQVGFRPYLAIFYGSVAESSATDLRSIVTNGMATTSIHSITDNNFMYFDHANGVPYSDSVISNNFVAATQWFTSHNIPISKMMIPHWSEIGVNAFAGLKAWGIEYVLIEVQPGTREYYSPFPPWEVLGPYRLFESPLQGQSLNPMVYADWLPIPGHPEFNGVFFDPYTEIRNVLPSPGYNLTDGGDWVPNTDVTGSIFRATQQIKRGLDSMTLGNVFTHERYIVQVPSASWLTILQGVTNNLAPYKPAYVTMDYANQYVRATRTSRISSSLFNPASGNVIVDMSGKTDLNISVQVYTGKDQSITNTPATVPLFNGAIEVTAAAAAPVSIPAPALTVTPQNGQIVLSFNTVPWQNYLVYSTPDVTSYAWPILTNIVATGTNVVFTNSVANAAQCFYRVQVDTSDP